jgi:Tfp pilus assembly protein PilF
MSFFSANSADATNIFTGMSVGTLQQALTQGQSARDMLSSSALSRGTDRMSTQDYEGAALEFKRAIGYSPNAADGYRLLSRTQMVLGQPDDAIVTLQRGMQMVPDNQSNMRADLAQIYVQQQRWGDAERTFKDIARENPNSPGPLTSLGYVYLSQDRLNEAEAHFNAVVNLVPRDATAHYNLGVVYNRQGRYEQAIQEFQTAIDTKEKYDYAYADMAQSYIALGDKDKARQLVQQLDFIGTDQAAGLADEIRGDLYTPKILYADVRYSDFPTNLGPGTTVAQLDPSLATPGASKVFKMVFQFNKGMDPVSVQNAFNWTISKANGGDGGVYNHGANLHPGQEVSIMPHPIGVQYDPLNATATVYFRVTQNEFGNGLIDPSHWTFAFAGFASDGKPMDAEGDQYNGYARGVF